MSIEAKLKELGDRFKKSKKNILTEEATKNAFVMPFISLLGYDVFNPIEVIPEFVSDVGIKKGEKVDYCIVRGGKPIIIIEAKCWKEKLEKHDSQLFRYFHVTKAKFAILTNGYQYKFYSDLKESNKMDLEPFFEVDITNLKKSDSIHLCKFMKDTYNEKSVIDTAGQLKVIKKIVKYINNQFENPDDDFVKYIGNKVIEGRLTKNNFLLVRESLHKAMEKFISGVVSERLKESLESVATKTVESIESKSEENEESKSEIVTTLEELEGFYAVKSIVKGKIDLGRVYSRDTKSYFGILIDDNNRKPLCRLRFNGSNKYVGIFIDGKEVKKPIEVIDDIYKLGSKIRRRAEELK